MGNSGSTNATKKRNIDKVLLKGAKVKAGGTLRPPTSVRFGFRRGSFDPPTRYFIRKTLADPRGWAGRGYTFVHRAHIQPVDVVLALCDKDEMDARFGHAPELRDLSVTNFGTRPARVYFHRDNWESPPPLFTGTLQSYREYLVQHEIGHALGRGHATEETDGGACPVMYQQSKGTSRCTPNAWITVTDE